MISLNRYWADNPPVHVLVAGFIGFKGSASRADSARSGVEEETQDAATMAAFDAGQTPVFITADEYVARKQRHGK